MNSLTLNSSSISIYPHLTLNWKKLIILGVILSFFLLGFYIFQIQTVINKEYKIEKYQQTITNLSKDASSLEMGAVGFNSLEKMENKIESLGLIKVEEIKYILISKDYLAGQIQ